MNQIQAYRGPDGHGTWRSSNCHCGLAHRRLAIIDLTEAAHQPMLDADLDLALTYNGEIYNYLELRDSLRAAGHRFRTSSDTEVLLRAYAEWGVDCLARLNGMFSFALWDGRQQSLFCARDRFGEKPFHFSRTGDAFAFASEAKALALLEHTDTGIHDGVLAAHADLGSTWLDASEQTLLRGIRQLLPAHALVVRLEEGALSAPLIWCYWSVDVEAREHYGDGDAEGSARELLDLLADSVRLRLRSDVTVGSCLSGGLDSSAIVSLIRRLEPSADLRTFTGRFPGDAADEGHFARLVVDAAHTTPAEVQPSAERFMEEAELVYWHADFPIGGMSQFAQWCVFHLAKEHNVTVLLDGQGSDEQFGGYGSSIVAAFLSQLVAERRLRAYWHERKCAASTNPALFSIPKLVLAAPGMQATRGLLRMVTNRSVLGRADLFDHDWLLAARSTMPSFEDEAQPSGKFALSRILRQLSFRTMLSSLLRFGDRLSMAHSREVRLPFCDHRIAQLAFSMAPELLVGEGEVKRVLRLAIRGLVPDAIVTRKKQGFVPPQDRWLVGPLRRWVQDLASDFGELEERMNILRVRDLVLADDSVRRRDVSLLWESTNMLAWETFARRRMRALDTRPATEG